MQYLPMIFGLRTIGIKNRIPCILFVQKNLILKMNKLKVHSAQI